MTNRIGKTLFVIVMAVSIAAAQPTRKFTPPRNISQHYHVVHDWPIVPDNTMLDEVSAVGVDSHGNVFVLMRGGRKWPDSGEMDKTPIPVATVHVFDGKTGQFITKWGEKVMALPHGLTVDANDNVWITDVALQQVFKFSHDGKLLLTVGEKGVAGEDTGHFNLPSGVATVKDGSFYVSDGYRNSRIVKFSPEGKYLLEWGKKGNADGELNLPHCVAVDYSLKVYVADRENKRIQIFDANGKFLRKIAGPPFITPQSIAVARDGTIYVTESGNEAPPDETGVLVLRPDGSFIERVGRYGNYDGQVQDPHWVAVGKNGELYVADFAGKRVQKFVRGK